MNLSIRPRHLLALLVAVTAGVLLAGCGARGSQPDLVNGKTLFVGQGTCGACHVLARAGTKGTQGPDLDAAFGAARAAGQGEATVAGIVAAQIDHPAASSIMPAKLLTGEDARDVAAYVGFVAGIPGEDEGALAAAGGAAQSDEPAVAKNGTIEIPSDPTGALAFTFPTAEAEAGEVEIVMPNEAPIEHNIAIQEVGAVGDVVGTGQDSTITADLDPGEYEYVCTVPGHAEGGMVGTLTVK